MENVASDIGVEAPSKVTSHTSLYFILISFILQEEVEEVMKELDENGDGKLSLDEFTVLIK